MFNNITIGQYYPVDSRIHRLDPRTKLSATFIYIIMLFFITNFYGYALVLGSLALLIYASNVPIKLLINGLKGIMFIILFTAILNVFFTTGGNIIFQFGIIKITEQGVIIAVKMALRLSLLIVGSSILTLTTSPIELTDAMEAGLKPFKKIGIPSHEIAMMMSIALRFIPTIMEEMNKIMKAQMARGADFDTGGIIKKTKSLIPLLVPLFISAFRRADDLAVAMEARCYRGDINRTRMKKLEYSKNDAIASLIIIIFSAMIIGSRFL